MHEIFKKLCKSHGITAYRFCKEMGINASTISTWKKNKSLAGPELAKKICEYFDISLDYLMGNNFIEDMGRIIQEERIDQKLSIEEVATQSELTIEDLLLYEGEEPIREDVFEDITKVLGTSYLELLEKYDLYDEYIPPYFEGDVIRYEAFKKAQDMDAMAENAEASEDILLISRAARKMTPENRKKLLDMAKIMFAEDFND